MIANIEHWLTTGRMWLWALVAVVLLGAAFFGAHASIIWLVLLIVGLGAVLLLRWPILGLWALIVAALIVPVEFGTGTAVALNPATLLVPALLVLWVLDMTRRQRLRLVPSNTNRPILLFLLASLLALPIGNTIWDPAVPRGENFTLVQLAQCAILVFSFGVFWLTGNLVRDEIWLRRLTFFFLALAGGLAILRVVPVSIRLTYQIATLALNRVPFWLVLTGLAGGQLLFNRELAPGWRRFLLVVLGVVLFYSFHLQRYTVSYWVGVSTVLAALAWLRFPRLRWVAVILFIVLVGTGLLPTIAYRFAGGEAEWRESGGSRVALIWRVVEETMRNPITGLGPAAYRRYTAVKPLPYGQALWLDPQINSHNNYVDLFSQFGLVGLGLFLWFAGELTRLGFRLRNHFTDGFGAGYVNAMLSIWAGALVVMLLLDWILPFVYNVGFPGFQASVLVWMFLGGLIALDAISKRETPAEAENET